MHGASSGAVTVVEPGDAARRGVTVIGIEQLFGFGPHVRRWAGLVTARAVAGDIRPVIGQTFPLERAAEAHAAVENRTAVGKTLVVTLSGEAGGDRSGPRLLDGDRP